VVAVVVADEEKGHLEELVLRLERESGKGRVKWHKAEHPRRMAFMEAVAAHPGFVYSLYVSVATGKISYLEATARSTAEAVSLHLSHQLEELREVRMVIDGLQKGERSAFRQTVSRYGLPRVTATGARDETTALVRLADALAGLKRAELEGSNEAANLVDRLKRRSILEEVS